MDLGFGQDNQAVGNVAAQALLQASKVQEQVLEDELSKYDALLNDDDALESLRRKRLEQMKEEHEKKAQWKAQGHGVYSELGQGQDARDVARDFFEASKHSERLVVHFYRPTSFCEIVHGHLQKLASSHLETKFVKINVDGCDQNNAQRGASYLVEQLGIRVMPTLVIVHKRQVVHHLRGFDELGGTSDFTTETLAYVLGQKKGLNCTEDEQEAALSSSSAATGVNRIRLRGKHIGGSSRTRQEEGEDF